MYRRTGWFDARKKRRVSYAEALADPTINGAAKALGLKLSTRYSLMERLEIRREQ